MTDNACKFCLDNDLLIDAPVARTDYFFVLASIDPDLPTAAMVLPRRHHADPFTITAEEWADFPNALSAAKAHLAASGPTGFTLGWNVGTKAGQTQPHAHLHVIARHDDRSAGQGIRQWVKEARAG